MADGATDGAGAGGAPDMEQIASSVVQDLQFRDVMHFYNSTVEQCFKQCVNSFQTRSLTKGESQCVTNCCKKIFQGNARLSMRYSEATMEKMQSASGSQ